MARTGLLIAAAVVAGSGIAPAVDADASRTIRASTEEVKRIGNWKVGRHPRFRHAIRAFAWPDSRRSPYGRTHCAARWRDFGLWADFANFGGGDACRPRDGLAARVTINGREAKRYRWRTWKGVRIGTSVRKLRRAHPSAERHQNGWWWIKTGRTYIGGNCPNGCPIPILKAHAKHRRVRSFRMWIGAAGD